MRATSGLPAGKSWWLHAGGIGLTLIILAIAKWSFTVLAAQPPKRPEPIQRSVAVRLDSARPHTAATVHFDLLSKLLADDRRGTPPHQWLAKLADPNAALQVAPHELPLLGQAAPDFSLFDHCGQAWSLRDQLARGPVVLVFYLGYSCNACVHDLCDLNADLARFQHFGAEIVAVSADAPEVTRQRFEQFGAFDFPLLSDPDHAVAESYDVFQSGDERRPETLLHGTFVIDRSGRVRWAQCGDTPFRNNMALLFELAQLKGSH